MVAQGAVWKSIGLWEFQLTNEYHDVYYPGECLTTGNTIGNWAYGYNIAGGNSFNQPTIGYSLYRLEVYNNYCEFFPTVYYFDYRDCDYPLRTRPDGTPSPNSNSTGGNDIWILYDAPTTTCSLSIDGALTWQLLNNNAYSSYWDIKNKSTHSPYTNYFPSYWQNCLALISSSGNHPHLVWGPHPTFNTTQYRIYRAVSNYPRNPQVLNYSLITTVSSSTFDYVDYAVLIIPGYQYAYYYVVGWDGTVQSDKTNYVSTQAVFYKQSAEIPNEFSISQNYPNPFNPTTSISYSIPENAFVTLKIYVVLGNEVEVLINEQKVPGNYQIDFNASELSSGIYYYTLTVGNFTSTKKMSLVK
ncbi:MAG: T9SS type A sorting domain-containing protein [Ignavibacteriales bacterium]|nr:T9SS type A sorting domain-containing protein [Ignavibacteriales bacterium]